MSQRIRLLPIAPCCIFPFELFWARTELLVAIKAAPVNTSAAMNTVILYLIFSPFKLFVGVYFHPHLLTRREEEKPANLSTKLIPNAGREMRVEVQVFRVQPLGCCPQNRKLKFELLTPVHREALEERKLT